MANAMNNPAAGWAAYKDACQRFSGDDQRDAFEVEADVADTAIMLPADTLDGVAAKLRRAFISLKGDGWAERLALGDQDAHSDLALSDPYTRMLWGAIEYLERMSARAEWDRALSAYSGAHAAATRKGLTDAECDDLSEADSLAFRAMVATPAPDMAALKTKMQIGLQHVWSQCHAEPEEVAALLSDVTRLSGEA